MSKFKAIEHPYKSLPEVKDSLLAASRLGLLAIAPRYLLLNVFTKIEFGFISDKYPTIFFYKDNVQTDSWCFADSDATIAEEYANKFAMELEQVIENGELGNWFHIQTVDLQPKDYVVDYTNEGISFRQVKEVCQESMEVVFEETPERVEFPGQTVLVFRFNN